MNTEKEDGALSDVELEEAAGGTAAAQKTGLQRRHALHKEQRALEPKVGLTRRKKEADDPGID